MASSHVDIDATPWTAGTAFCGPDAIFEGQEIVQVKLLSDRRSEGRSLLRLIEILRKHCGSSKTRSTQALADSSDARSANRS